MTSCSKASRSARRAGSPASSTHSPHENRALWDLATTGNGTKPRALYRWYTPLLHLDTKVKLVQYIKLAMQETGLGTELTRAPRLPIVGAERERILGIIRRRHRHAPRAAQSAAA